MIKISGPMPNEDRWPSLSWFYCGCFSSQLFTQGMDLYGQMDRMYSFHLWSSRTTAWNSQIPLNSESLSKCKHLCPPSPGRWSELVFYQLNFLVISYAKTAIYFFMGLGAPQNVLVGIERVVDTTTASCTYPSYYRLMTGHSHFGSILLPISDFFHVIVFAQSGLKRLLIHQLKVCKQSIMSG